LKKKKKKEELAELESKYINAAIESSESSEFEDEDGLLLSSKIENKFLDLIPKIIAKDTSIYNSKVNFFY